MKAPTRARSSEGGPRSARQLGRAGFGLVVAGIVVASTGLPSGAWSSLMLAGFALMGIAAFASAARQRG